ncbi:hypothetical protein HHK36_008284 [Tetracentron sinense]|uniref:Uncharacterized protein n=1 Tax=Tetracentron sinense TaxID=13715 RepID=A0A834ZF66_TETSI|nr:hypothetical protein HHK36_008284 [Tetracentron sinense]
MSKISLIYNTISIKILALLSTGATRKENHNIDHISSSITQTRPQESRKLTKELCKDKESMGISCTADRQEQQAIFAGIEGSAVKFSKIATSSIDWV